MANLQTRGRLLGSLSENRETGGKVMIKGAIKALAFVATASLLGLSAPGSVHAEVPMDGYQSNISKAKAMMVKNPIAALDLARGAKYFVEGDAVAALKDHLTANWLEGEALMRLNRSEEAAGVIRPALSKAQKSFAEEKIYADLLRSAASLEGRIGNSRQALAYFLLAQERYERLGETRSQAIVLQNIGSLYSQSREYERVLKYYRKAAEVFSDDAILSLSAHNNIGNALRGMDRFAEAESEFGKALIIARKMASPLLEARILTNLAAAQRLGGAGAQAEETAKIALALAEEHALDWSPFIYGVLAQVELDRGDLVKADDYISRTFADVPLDTSNALFRDFHETASKIFERNGREDLAELHAAAFDRLDRQAEKLKLAA